MWVRTVSVLRPSWLAALVGRVAVGVELEDLALAAGQRAARRCACAPPGRRRSRRRRPRRRRAASVGRRRALGDVGGGAGARSPRWPRWRSGRGAVGDDPEPGRALGAAPDRRRCRRARRGAVAAAAARRSRRRSRPSERDQLERVAAVGGLLDLVAVGEQAADPEPHGRLLVDDQAASFVVHRIAPMPGAGRPRSTLRPASRPGRDCHSGRVAILARPQRDASGRRR